MKMEFSKFEGLPDYLSVEILEMYFNQVIDYYYENIESVNLIDLLEGLFHLAERQWHTYHLLNEEIKERIESIIVEIIDPNSFEILDSVTSIIALLGLTKSFQALKKLDKRNLIFPVRELIEETIKELDGHVENPYSSLE